MKKRIIAVILCLSTLCLASCSQSTNPALEECILTSDISSETEKMPPPFEITYGGGDNTYNFYQMCVEKFDSIPAELQALVPQEEAEKFYAQFSFDNPNTSIEKSLNVYTFKEYFNISDEQFSEVMQKNNDFYISIGETMLVLTNDEISAICDGNIKSMSQMFVSPYSICIGDKIYTPNWLYYCSEEDFDSAGIPTEKIISIADKYPQLYLSKKGSKAFGEKLSKYTGFEVHIEEPANYYDDEETNTHKNDKGVVDNYEYVEVNEGGEN